MSDLEEDQDQHVRFVLQGDVDFSDVSRVKMVIAPARSVWDDFFDGNDYKNHTVCYDLKKMGNGQFAANIPLKVNIYHFLFQIDNCESDFISSRGHHVTYLANGRKLNYVNVGNLNEILVNQDIDGQPNGTNDELRSPVVDSSTGNPQPRVPGKNRKRMLFCCYLD